MSEDEPLSKYESLDRLGRRLGAGAEAEGRPRASLPSWGRGTLLAVVAALILGAAGGAAVAGLTDAFEESSVEERYIDLLNEERDAGLCKQAIADGHENFQCQRILDDLKALDSGTYEPRFEPGTGPAR